MPLMEQGDFEEALVELRQLQQLDRGGAEAVQWEAICLLALNEQPKAVRTLKEGIVKFPEEHSLSVVLAEVYLSLGQSQLAVPVLLDLLRHPRLRLQLLDDLLSRQPGHPVGAALAVDTDAEFDFLLGQFERRPVGTR